MTKVEDRHRAEARERAAKIIDRMCMTMDHSFGLQTPEQQRGLRLSMSQLAEHDIAPAIAAALAAAEKRGREEEREECAEAMEIWGATESNDAILWAREGLAGTAKISEIRSKAHFDTAAAIRARKDEP